MFFGFLIHVSNNVLIGTICLLVNMVTRNTCILISPEIPLSYTCCMDVNPKFT